MSRLFRFVCMTLFVIGIMNGEFLRTCSGKEGALKMKISCDHPDGLYAKGEAATISIKITRGGQPNDGGEITYKVALHGERKQLDKGKVAVKGGAASFKIERSDPSFVLCTIIYKSIKGNSLIGKIGIGFDVYNIQPGTAMPKDFKAFWAAARKERDAIPMDLKLTKIENKQPGFDFFKFSMANINNTRTYGYLTVPKGKGPFPAMVTVPHAGPGYKNPFFPKYAKLKALTISVNVHDYDIQPYDGKPVDLNKVYRGSYSVRGAPDPKAYYFYRAILGVDRAIDYLASRPEWDGKHMVMKGVSQGGGFTLILTGLNKHITAAAAAIPGMCDHAGYRAQHGTGWPGLIPRIVRNKNDEKEKKWLNFVSYFDSANFAQSITCPVVICVGLIDSSGRAGPDFAVFNQLKGPKRAFTDPMGGHTSTPAYKKHLEKWMLGQLGKAEPIAPLIQAVKEKGK